MQNKSEHQFLQRDFFFIKFFEYERLGYKEGKWEETTGQAILFFYHVYGRDADSLVQTCNQL